jgi:hypothetical protein
MQLEAHRIENIKNRRREVWFYWIACKRTMNARPRKPRFLSKVRNIVKPGGRANGVTDFGDKAGSNYRRSSPAPLSEHQSAKRNSPESWSISRPVMAPLRHGDRP